MPTARELIDQAESAMAETEAAIRNHPFARAIEDGRAGKAALHLFLGNQYQMWKSNDVSVSMARFANHPYRDVFLTPPEVEASAARECVALAARLGMEQRVLERFEPNAQAFAYAAYKAWLICYGSAAELACARALNLAAWGHNCGLISRGLQTHFGLTKEETRFFDGFSGLEKLKEKAAVVIDDDLKNGVEPFMIVRAARLMQDYEKAFWDTMARLSGIRPAP